MIRIKVARTFNAPDTGSPPLRCMSYSRVRSYNRLLLPWGEGAPKRRMRGWRNQWRTKSLACRFAPSSRVPEQERVAL